MAAVHLVVPTVVADIMHLGRIGVDPTRPVFNDRTVLPARLPQLVAHVAVLIGDGVALVVIGQACLSIVAARTFEVGGHDIPRHPPFGQMVEGRDEPGKGERRVLEYGTGETKSQMLGRVRHGRDEQHGIVDRYLGGFRHGRLPVAAKHIVHANHIGQKQRIESPAFQQLGQFHPLVEVGVIDHIVIFADPQPWRLVHDTVHVKGVEVDALVHADAPGGTQALPLPPARTSPLSTKAPGASQWEMRCSPSLPVSAKSRLDAQGENATIGATSRKGHFAYAYPELDSRTLSDH